MIRMNDFIRKQDILRTWQNVCIGISCPKCQFYNDDTMNGDCLLERWVHTLPSAEPKKVLVAEVKLSKEDIQDAVDEAVAKIMAQQERKKGKWIELTNTNHTYVCSVCGRMLVNISDGKNNVTKSYPFCHCGADMRGEHDE